MRPAVATVIKREFFLGLDLGQRRDHTAIAIIEPTDILTPERNPVTWEPVTSTRTSVRFLQRMPLHTPYTTIAEHVTASAANWPRWVNALSLSTQPVSACPSSMPSKSSMRPGV